VRNKREHAANYGQTAPNIHGTIPHATGQLLRLSFLCATGVRPALELEIMRDQRRPTMAQLGTQ